MGYKICPYCGATLDPEEKCDCRNEKSYGDPDRDRMKRERQAYEEAEMEDKEYEYII